MLNFIYKCVFTKAERSGRERKAMEALRTERDIAQRSRLGGKQEKAAGWRQPLWNKISKLMLRKTFQ